MPWQPGPKPPWVDAINRGEVPSAAPGVPNEVAAIAADVVDSARRPLGDDLDLRGAPAGFAVFLEAVEAEADLTPLGRWATRRYLARLLEGRRLLADEFAADQALGDNDIAEPIFVLGAPRSGTTVLHRLLAALPGVRTPLGWELLYPTATAQLADNEARVAAAADELGFPQMVASGLHQIHQYSAQMPKECLSAMAFSGKSEEFISRYDVPSYVSWLQNQTLGPAYVAHKQVLQILQRDAEPATWLLKSPVHLQGLPELIATYPDARFVITHRDPTEVLASVSSLICTLRSAFSDNVDAEAVGSYHLELYSRSLNQLVARIDAGVLPADRTVHLHHSDIVADAPAQIASVCAALGRPIDDETQARIALQHRMPRDDSVGQHSYDGDAFGLDEAAVADRFGPYLEKFGRKRR